MLFEEEFLGLFMTFLCIEEVLRMYEMREMLRLDWNSDLGATLLEKRWLRGEKEGERGGGGGGEGGGEEEEEGGEGGGEGF